MKAPSFTMHRLATDESALRVVIDAACSVPNGEPADVERTIASLETKYGMSSKDARGAIERGELSLTREIEGWMMTLRVWEHLADVKARAR
jgi:hypothetical protein